MTVPIQPVPDPRIVANLQRLKDAGAGEDVMNAYLAEETAKGAQHPPMNAAKIRARQNANEADMADAETPSVMGSVLGGIAALNKNIPGMEAVQAFARSKLRGQTYGDALKDIRGAEADNPASGVNSFIGGTVAAAATPGSPMASGAGFGVANGLLQADGSLEDRAKSAAVQGSLGALLGYAAPKLASYAQSKITPKIDVQQLARTKASQVADAKLYGAAEAEGLGRSGAPTAFQNPVIQEYLDMVKAAPQFKGADDATVMREAYKLMSRDQGGHASFMARNGFDAARQLKADALGVAKQELMQHAETIMPSFPKAVSTHAANANLSEVSQQASDIANRLLSKAHISGENIPLKGTAQFKEEINKMTPDVAGAALDMVLGRAKEYRAGGKINPLKLFGLGSNLSNMSKLQPLLDLLAQQSGRAPFGQATKAIGQGALTSLYNR